MVIPKDFYQEPRNYYTSKNSKKARKCIYEKIVKIFNYPAKNKQVSLQITSIINSTVQFSIRRTADSSVDERPLLQPPVLMSSSSRLIPKICKAPDLGSHS